MAQDNSETNLIVNYLPQTLTDEEFRSMFQNIGALKSCKIIRDKATGYSYGFGFVDYVTKEDAGRAIKSLNGLQLQTKTIKVALARHGQNIKGANLYVRNLPKEMDQGGLQELFQAYGAIVQCRILTDPFGNSKRVGFVLFNNKEEAQAAINGLDGYTPEGSTESINVKFAEDNRGKARPPAVMPNRGGFQQGGFYGNNNQAAFYNPAYNAGYGNAGFGAGAFPRGGMRGGRGGGPVGPVRNQPRFANNRFNPMSAGTNNAFQMDNGSGTGEGGYVLFVYNIGLDADERSLWQLFSPFGSIQKVNVIRDYQKNQCKGYGFVTMTNYAEAENAIANLNGYRYVTKPLQVSFKSDKQS